MKVVPYISAYAIACTCEPSISMLYMSKVKAMVALKVLNFASMDASRSCLWSMKAVHSRSAEPVSSPQMIMMAGKTIEKEFSSATIITRIEQMTSLSATGSRNLPKDDSCFNSLASRPSIVSVNMAPKKQ